MTVVQIKELKNLIDEQMKLNDRELVKHEQERNEAMKEVSNHLHESCIISNDEVWIQDLELNVLLLLYLCVASFIFL